MDNRLWVRLSGKTENWSGRFCRTTMLLHRRNNHLSLPRVWEARKIKRTLGLSGRATETYLVVNQLYFNLNVPFGSRIYCTWKPNVYSNLKIGKYLPRVLSYVVSISGLNIFWNTQKRKVSENYGPSFAST